MSAAHSSGLAAEQRQRLAVVTFKALSLTTAESSILPDANSCDGQGLECPVTNDTAFKNVALKLLADSWSAVRQS